jgi:hypothetical protein
MDSQERAIFDRYAAGPGLSETARILSSVRLPLVLAGGYVQTVSQLMIGADFGKPVPIPTSSTITSGLTTGLTFDTVRSALETGREPVSGSYLVVDVNAESNIISALICHADGMRPQAVCTRPAIKEILNRVK